MCLFVIYSFINAFTYMAPATLAATARPSVAASDAASVVPTCREGK